jgi:hypothetical protein
VELLKEGVFALKSALYSSTIMGIRIAFRDSVKALDLSYRGRFQE